MNRTDPKIPPPHPDEVPAISFEAYLGALLVLCCVLAAALIGGFALYLSLSTDVSAPRAGTTPSCTSKGSGC